MNAIKNLQWLAVAVCLFVMGTIRVMADDKKDDAPEVPIPLTSGIVLTGNDMRNGETIPFIAYYYRGNIYICTSAEFSTIEVDVENETTGQIWSTTVDISDGMGEISIANGYSGCYSVEITTEYNECFIGDFTL